MVTVAVATNARRIFQKLLEKNVKASNGRAKVSSLITIFQRAELTQDLNKNRAENNVLRNTK